MKKLILITNAYPHEAADHPFVDSEIRGLAQRYENVRIIAAQAQPGTHCSVMPSNVEFYAGVPTGALSAVQHVLRQHVSIAELVAMIRAEHPFPHTARSFQRLLFGAMRGSLVAKLIRRAMSDLSWEGADIYFFWGAWGAYSIPWLLQIPNTIVVRFHGGDLYEERSEGYLPFRREILGRADKILTVSKHGRDYLLRSRFTRTKLISHVNLGTHDRGIGPLQAEESLHIVSCSALTPNKRVHLIVDAVKYLADKGHPVRWTHIGDGPEMSNVRKRVEATGLAANVELVGSVKRSWILDYYQEAQIDVFVNTSLSEGAPVSIMEALSFDIPVAAASVGGVPGMFPESGRVAALFPPQSNDEVIATAILTAATLRSRFPNKRREHWMMHYNSEANANHVARFIYE